MAIPDSIVRLNKEYFDEIAYETCQCCRLFGRCGGNDVYSVLPEPAVGGSSPCMARDIHSRGGCGQMVCRHGWCFSVGCRHASLDTATIPADQSPNRGQSMQLQRCLPNGHSVRSSKRTVMPETYMMLFPSSPIPALDCGNANFNVASRSACTATWVRS